MGCIGGAVCSLSGSTLVAHGPLSRTKAFWLGMVWFGSLGLNASISNSQRHIDVWFGLLCYNASTPQQQLGSY